MHIYKFITAIIVFVLLNGCSKTQIYYIKNASLPLSSEQTFVVENNDFSFYEKYENDKKKNRELLLGGHYIKEGKNIVLLIRKWKAGKIYIIDDEWYEKLTIEIKDYQIGIPIIIPSDQAKLYYSKGGSAWIDHGAGFYSSDATGEILLSKISERNLIVKINISLKAKSADSLQKKQKIRAKFEGEYSFSKILLSDLTPWLGMPDPPLYTGGYPD